MTKRVFSIPLIDLFAGPGGLCEGFCSCSIRPTRIRFDTVLSIEKERFAHMTLELRSFFRQFRDGVVPKEYYEYLRGEITRTQLFQSYPAEAARAQAIAWHAELGSARFPNHVVDRRIRKALAGAELWVLVGGPPCQAYSLVGRSRMRSGSPEAFDRDPRHFLYREYLRILSVHRPPFFVLENVKGLLSSKVNGQNMFSAILHDLRSPKITASGTLGRRSRDSLSYNIYPVAQYDGDFFGDNPDNFIVRCELHGIPQARHRIILLGIRSDLRAQPTPIPCHGELVSCWTAIRSLPKLRSEVNDMDCGWDKAVGSLSHKLRQVNGGIDPKVRRGIISAIESISSSLPKGGQYVSGNITTPFLPEWFWDSRLAGACNHKARSHMVSDLHRYLFAACFAAVNNRSPVLRDFPRFLLPHHDNVTEALRSGSGLFSDRFRVQIKTRPATTITSHIAKDGHYYIHPDPSQCRSLTVREAARLQTFPDNYFFEGPQTAQYQQVGNAVPPLLARMIANVVAGIILKSGIMSS